MTPRQTNDKQTNYKYGNKYYSQDIFKTIVKDTDNGGNKANQGYYGSEDYARYLHGAHNKQGV